MTMEKIKKSAIVTIRMLPSEKQATIELADRLGLDLSDVVRLSLHEVLKRKDLSTIFNPQAVISTLGVQNG